MSLTKALSSISIAVILLIAEIGIAVYFTYLYLPSIIVDVNSVLLYGCLLMITLVFWLIVFQFNDSFINRGILSLHSKESEWEEKELEHEDFRGAVEDEVELLTIAYGTKKSVTPESAQKIASLLHHKFGLEIDIINLDENPSLNQQYNNIIIGSSLTIGKWTTHTAVVQFLEQNRKNENEATSSKTKDEKRVHLVGRHKNRSLTYLVAEDTEKESTPN